MPPRTHISKEDRPKEQTTFNVWRCQRGLSYSTMARLIGCNVATIQRWCEGRNVPSLVSCFKIERVTQGGVPVASWLDLEIAKVEWYDLEQGAKSVNARFSQSNVELAKAIDVTALNKLAKEERDAKIKEMQQVQDSMNDGGD